jgi:2-oxoglutarate/2-oxoacid ferredoxin oxidoreductase subunit alpha
LPAVEDLPDLTVAFASGPNHTLPDGTEVFWPYERDPSTLARPWAIPGTPGLEHRVGGIEKADGTGNISYDPANHERMVRLRAAKVAGIAASIPATDVDDPYVTSPDASEAEILVIGWGSTWGAIKAASNVMRDRGKRVATAHLVHLNPFPSDLGQVLRRYPRVLVPEMNLGQLSRLIRAEFLVDAKSYSKIQGVPFTAAELETAITSALASGDPR